MESCSNSIAPEGGATLQRSLSVVAEEQTRARTAASAKTRKVTGRFFSIPRCADCSCPTGQESCCRAHGDYPALTVGPPVLWFTLAAVGTLSTDRAGPTAKPLLADHVGSAVGGCSPSPRRLAVLSLPSRRAPPRRALGFGTRVASGPV
ncbi:hypothetical protein SKAU_G00101290 [Synaphobranchus kaupii]|uniref:Uncharacterized protein n=1 Tax=Synaphobranchus kaupii TaxID=118154 RepID=A0A9Q1FZL0_SYNKA|nr:hypothetical protein SKAU_G00101290 [Synaphobranchus kaupii]